LTVDICHHPFTSCSLLFAISHFLVAIRHLHCTCHLLSAICHLPVICDHSHFRFVIPNLTSLSIFLPFVACSLSVAICYLPCHFHLADCTYQAEGQWLMAAGKWQMGWKLVNSDREMTDEKYQISWR
jgi:hypothetical protein